MHQLPPDGVSGQRRFEQTDDHGPRRLRLRSRHKRRNRHEAHRAEELRCHEGRAGSRQRQRVHLDAGGLYRGRLEHLAHIDLQKPHHALRELRRHDRLDGPRFGHRGRGEHLHGRLRMREPRRHAEHLRRIGRRTPGQHHLYPRHLVGGRWLHELRRHRCHQCQDPRRRARLSDQLRRQRGRQFGQLRQRDHRPGDLPRNARGQHQQRRETGQQHRRRRRGIVQRRQLRDGADRRNQLHGLHRPDQDGQ